MSFQDPAVSCQDPSDTPLWSLWNRELQGPFCELQGPSVSCKDPAVSCKDPSNPALLKLRLSELQGPFHELQGPFQHTPMVTMLP